MSGRIIKITFIVVLLSVIPVVQNAFADDTARDKLSGLQKEFGAVNGHIYSSLERMPVRRWGSRQLASVFWELRNRLNKLKQKGAAVTDKEISAAIDYFNNSSKKVINELRLAPAGTISFSDNGTPILKLSNRKIIFYKDVPDAILLEVEPSPKKGELLISADSTDNLKVQTEPIELRRFLTDYAVINITAEKIGEYKITVNLSVNGKDSVGEMPIEVRPCGKFVGKIISAADNTPLTAKLFVESADGRLYVMPGETNYKTQEWYAYYQPRYSCVDANFLMSLPPGKYHVTVMKGYSYKSRETDIDIAADHLTGIKFSLKNLFPTEPGEWFTADMHTHSGLLSRRWIPAEKIRRFISAEGLNFVANTLYSTEKPAPMRLQRDVSDDTHLLFDQQEIEHWNFGNSFYINVPHTATDPEGVDNPRMTPMFFYDEQVHKMGGTTMRWIRGRPFSPKGSGQQQPELAVDIPLGYLDVWQILNNTQQESLDRPDNRWTGNGWANSSYYDLTYKTWYGLMNCGLRVPISAGTSYGRLSRLGFNRVYLRTEKPLTVAKLTDALKKGDGFVTNGPLLLLKANGKWPGEGLALQKGEQVEFQLWMKSQYPVELVEIIRNGKVIESRQLPADYDGLLQITHKVMVDKPCWFAARCFGTYKPRYPHSASHNQFAHTNAIFATVNGNRPRSSKDAAKFIREIDALIEFIPNIPQPLQERTREVFGKARRYFAETAVEK